MQKISMQPSGSVYSQFKHMSYKPATALMEFLDNSIQSFINHENELKSLAIEVVTNSEQIIIRDNAYGMDLETFEKALRLGDRPKHDNAGLNKFGMGMKTAAFWFSENWTIRTSKYGSNQILEIPIGITDVEGINNPEVECQITYASRYDHFTEITLSNLNHKVDGRHFKSLKQILAKVYREYLNRGEISICINGEYITYEEPKIRVIDDKPARIEIAGSFEHDGNNYRVNGWIGLLHTGSRNNAGLALFHNKRAIKWDHDGNSYRPPEIFKDAASYEFQRIVGALDVPDFPVTQMKDDFQWYNGLEETFVNWIKNNEEFSNLNKMVKISYKTKTEEIKQKDVKKIKKSLKDVFSDINKLPEVNIKPVEQSNFISLNKINETINLIYNDEVYNFDFTWEEQDPYDSFIKRVKKDGITHIKINSNHHFLRPKINSKDEMINYQTFFISWLLAVQILENSDEDGYIDPSQMITLIDEILRKTKND